MTALSLPARLADRLRRVRPFHALVTLLLFAGAWAMVFPYIWMISSSLKPANEVFDADFSILPKTFAGWQNYSDVIFGQPYPRFILNSLIVCLGILIVQIVTAVPAAYALAKLRFRGSRVLLGTVIACLTIPINVTSIPIYLGVVKVGLLDTYVSMMFPFFVSVFAIFLFRQFFRSFPDDIINAARLDGMGELEIIWRIVTPSAMPAIAAFSVFSIVAHWNDLYWPLIVISDNQLAPPPLGMLLFADAETGSNYGALTAAATMLTAPLVICFLVARKRFIQGITMTGVK